MRALFHSFVVPTSLPVDLSAIQSLRDAISKNYSDWEIVFVASEKGPSSQLVEQAIQLGEIENSRLMFVAAKKGQTDFENSLPGALSSIGDRVTVILDIPSSLEDIFQGASEETPPTTLYSGFPKSHVKVLYGSSCPEYSEPCQREQSVKVLWTLTFEWSSFLESLSEFSREQQGQRRCFATV
jgi:hypothetical protein